VVQEALTAADQYGAETTLVDLRQHDLPRFDPNKDEPTDATQLTDTLRDADAVILGTPMYHGSYSSTIKNALDYSSQEDFADTTVGLVAVSGGAFPVSALEHLRTVCRALGARVRPKQVAIPNVNDAIEGDTIQDDDYAERVCALGEEVAEYAAIEPVGIETPKTANTASSDD